MNNLHSSRRQRPLATEAAESRIWAQGGVPNVGPARCGARGGKRGDEGRGLKPVAF
ncbi:MAG: hypothetical protein AB9879_14660 [Methanothrix sp.]